MGFLLTVLTLPVLGPPLLAAYVARTIAEEAERELLDEGRVRGALLELLQRYEAGDIDGAEYDRQESALLARLDTIRELKERRSQAG